MTNFHTKLKKNFKKSKTIGLSIRIMSKIYDDFTELHFVLKLNILKYYSQKILQKFMFISKKPNLINLMVLLDFPNDENTNFVLMDIWIYNYRIF